LNENCFFHVLKNRTKELVLQNNLIDEEIVVSKYIQPNGQINGYRIFDQPITDCRILVEVELKGVKGSAISDRAGGFVGTLRDLFDRDQDMTNAFDRAVLIATSNAIIKYLSVSDRKNHCNKEQCMFCLLDYLNTAFDNPRIAIIGSQSAIFDILRKNFIVTMIDIDGNSKNKEKCNVVVEGPEATKKIIKWCDVIVIVEKSIEKFDIAKLINKKPVILYEETSIQLSKLTNFPGNCPFLKKHEHRDKKF